MSFPPWEYCNGTEVMSYSGRFFSSFGNGRSRTLFYNEREVTVGGDIVSELHYNILRTNLQDQRGILFLPGIPFSPSSQVEQGVFYRGVRWGAPWMSSVTRRHHRPGKLFLTLTVSIFSDGVFQQRQLMRNMRSPRSEHGRHVQNPPTDQRDCESSNMMYIYIVIA